MTTPSLLLATALGYAASGWSVFPLVPGSKRPAVDQWETRATTDLERIHAAWSTGRYGIGIACGPSGLLVLDLDVPKPGRIPPPQWRRPGLNDGLDVLAAVCEDAGQRLPPATFTVATPSGGRHLYYRQPTGVQLRNTYGERGGLGWLVDTRGHGGYVAAPGTAIDGRAYTTVDDAPVAELPHWLADRLTASTSPPPSAGPVQLRTEHLTRYLDRAVRTEVDHVRAAAAGGRNHALYIAAQNLGQLVAGGALDEATARAALTTGAAVHVGIDRFTEREAQRTITSGLAAGAKRPRQVAA